MSGMISLSFVIGTRVFWATAAVAWAAYALSWFLPVLHIPEGGLFSDIDAGWKAFATTVLGIFSPNKLGWISLFFLGSVLSNVPVLMSPWMLRRVPPARWFIIALAAGFLLNLAWIPLLERIRLLVGYWLWVGSMFVLAVVAIAGRAGAGVPEGPSNLPQRK